MRRAFISSIFLLIFIILTTTASIIVSSKFTNLINLTEVTSIKVSKNNFSSALKKLSELENSWNQNKKIFCLFHNKKEIEKLDTEISKVKVSLAASNPVISLTRLNKISKAFTTLKNSNQLSLESLL